MKDQFIRSSPKNQSVAILDRLRLFEVRGQTVVLDSDLAAVYGVTTKVFNQAIKRNASRFPADFLVRLTAKEWAALRSQFVTLDTPGRGQHRKYLPAAFTEHGAIMAASILNSECAIAMSVYVVRAFVRLRRELLVNATLETRLQRIEKDLLTHDAALRYSTPKSNRCSYPRRSRRGVPSDFM